MDANGIYDLDKAVDEFLRKGKDWCKDQNSAIQFEQALIRRGVKYLKERTNPRFGGYEMVFELVGGGA
jgi:hypothetical protein